MIRSYLAARRARRERHGRVLAAELARYAADRDRAPAITADQLIQLARERKTTMSDTIDVYARALRVEHVPVIDGAPVELVAVARAGEEIHVRWVPHGADLDTVPREGILAPDDLVPCLRRSEVRT